jgi:hypothetical protein
VDILQEEEMASKLKTIMKLLDPIVIAKKIDFLHERARLSYRIDDSPPQSFLDFRKGLQAYYAHHCAAIGMGEMPDEISGRIVINMVESAFSDQGGIRGAFEIARIGIGGGMYSLLDAIADTLREQHRRDYIRYVIDTNIDPLDFDQKVAVVRELQEYFNCGNGYPKTSPEELAANHYALFFSLVQHLKWCYSMCIKNS